LSKVIKSCYGITSVPKSSLKDYASGLVGYMRTMKASWFA